MAANPQYPTMPLEAYYTRVNTHWSVHEYTHPEDVIDLPSLGCHLALSDIYDKVSWQD